MIEQIAEKAVFAAEALERSLSEDGRREDDRTRCASLQREAVALDQDIFGLMDRPCRTRLSREQTRALTRAMRGICEAVRATLEQAPCPGHDAYHAASATALRRSAEQVRLAVSGLREPADQPGVLRSCAHIRALHREGDCLARRAVTACAVQTGTREGLRHCLEAAQTLESAFGVAPRRSSA